MNNKGNKISLLTSKANAQTTKYTKISLNSSNKRKILINLEPLSHRFQQEINERKSTQTQNKKLKKKEEVPPLTLRNKKNKISYESNDKSTKLSDFNSFFNSFEISTEALSFDLSLGNISKDYFNSFYSSLLNEKKNEKVCVEQRQKQENATFSSKKPDSFKRINLSKTQRSPVYPNQNKSKGSK